MFGLIRIFREMLRVQRESLAVQYLILEKLMVPVNVTGFTIARQGASPMDPITPGTTAVYTAVAIPDGVTLSTPPTWITSDPVNAPITVDPTGLIATVDVPATAIPGSFTLTINYTNSDASVATGQINDSITAVVPPVTDVRAFTITRTA